MPSLLSLLPWLIAAASLAALIAVVFHRRRTGVQRPVPPKGPLNLAVRPVFNAEERRAYRQLREALPHHVILAKLPLVRLCQANDPAQQAYWYDLLGRTYVSFAICSPNGRVLAALDLEADAPAHKRSTEVQQAVFDACRIRYLRCTPHALPSIGELQLMVPQSGVPRGPQAAPSRPADASAVAAASDARPSLWQDAAALHDSFFAPDTRGDSVPAELDAAASPAPLRPASGRR